MLSEIKNKDWANNWLEDSERDLKAAGSLMRDEIYERAVYHCQQAVEKTVKAILICFGAYENLSPIFAGCLTVIIKYIYFQTYFSFMLFSQGIS